MEGRRTMEGETKAGAIVKEIQSEVWEVGRKLGVSEIGASRYLSYRGAGTERRRNRVAALMPLPDQQLLRNESLRHEHDTKN